MAAILEVARIDDGGNRRRLNFNMDILNLPNLSILYRHVVLARGVKMQIADLCKLISLFGATPFSTWDMQQEEFTNISPQGTVKFYNLATSIKLSGFKVPVLEYILQGTLPADSRLGLDEAKNRTNSQNDPRGFGCR